MSHTVQSSVLPLAGREQRVGAQIGWIVSFSALTAIGAQIEIPHYPVPYTLQTLFVLLSGALLGMRNGALAQVFYLALGAAGLPVFSGFGFGIERLLGPTGGYLLGFPVAALTVAYLARQSANVWWLMISMLTGLAIIFSLGTLQLYFVLYRDWAAAFTNGFLIFSWWDILKLGASVGVCKVLMNRYRAQ